MSNQMLIGVGLVAFPIGFAAIFAISGVFVFCGGHAFAFEALSANGQCLATDTPSEVAGSFAVLGALVAILISLFFAVIYWVSPQRDESSR